jgi:3-hydroxyisobutyrate dehydrogenase-like beta-hydroxyacid dehydrogenase
VVLVNVVDDAQVERVVLGDAGLLSSLAEGAVVVVHSTVHPATCVHLAEVAAEKGVHLVDAPFTGGAAAAAAGRLSLLVGGQEKAVEAARPVLEAEGTVLHLGPVGAGELAKLGNNLVLGITLAAVHEALQLATTAGLDREVMLRVLTSGAADNWVARNWESVGRMAATYPRGAEGIADLTRKDLNLALRVGDDAGLRLPLTDLTSRSLREPYEAAQRHLEGVLRDGHTAPRAL